MVQAQTKAADGMELPVYATYYARSLAGLPAEAKLVEDVRALVVTLARLRTAPVVDPYSGPAILSGRAAGVFFHEIFGHRIEGSRQKTADDAQTFAKMVGQSVLPSVPGASWRTRRARSSATPSWPASTSTTTRACVRAAWRS